MLPSDVNLDSDYTLDSSDATPVLRSGSFLGFSPHSALQQGQVLFSWSHFNPQVTWKWWPHGKHMLSFSVSISHMHMVQLCFLGWHLIGRNFEPWISFFKIATRSLVSACFLLLSQVRQLCPAWPQLLQRIVRVDIVIELNLVFKLNVWFLLIERKQKSISIFYNTHQSSFSH